MHDIDDVLKLTKLFQSNLTNLTQFEACLCAIHFYKMEMLDSIATQLGKPPEGVENTTIPYSLHQIASRLDPDFESDNPLFAKHLWIPEVYQDKIIEQIFRLCERQYRNGFLHAKMDQKVSPEEASIWHSEGMDEDFCNVVDPVTGFSHKSEFILRSATAMRDMKELQSFLKL